MAPQMELNYFWANNWQLWDWIRWRSPHPPSATNPSIQLYHHHRLGGKKNLELNLTGHMLPNTPSASASCLWKDILTKFFWNTYIPNKCTLNLPRRNTAKLSMVPSNNLALQIKPLLLSIPQTSKVSRQSLERYYNMYVPSTTNSYWI